jgi:hypothetical protein
MAAHKAAKLTKNVIAAFAPTLLFPSMNAWFWHK